MAPSTFASAAAGNAPPSATTRDVASDWPRRSNGATQTFRRQSGAPTTSTSNNDSNNHQPETSAPSQPAPRYVPPHRNGTLSEIRYTKEQMLDLYRSQHSSGGEWREGLSELYVGGWQPDAANGAATPGWAGAEYGREMQHGPDLCWDREGSVEPAGLRDMDDEEREHFSASVNTPLKPPSAVNKDGHQMNGTTGRKVSVSNSAHPFNSFGLPSPSITRGPVRRRDTSDSYPFPSNPFASPSTGRDEQRGPSPPPSLTRRRTDLIDSSHPGDVDNVGDEKSSSNLFGSLKRSPPDPLGAGLGAPSSPWPNAPQSAGFSPMGSFGNFGIGGAQANAPIEKRPGVASGRSESRFKNLLSKDSSEDVGSPSVQRKGSMSNLSRVNENGSWRPQEAVEAPLPERDENLPSGSASLTTGSDHGPPYQRQGLRGFGTPSRSSTQDDFGFGAFGMTSDGSHALGPSFMTSQQRTGQILSGNEPMSPTDTNPYQSPEQRGVDHLVDGLEVDDVPSAPLPGLGGFGNEQAQQLSGLGGLGGLSHFGRGPAAQGSDRSQTSSAGAGRGFPTLGGLGQLGSASGAGAWPVTAAGFGTPGRQAASLSSAFGGGIFATSTAEMQSPGLAGLGGPNMMGPQSAGGFAGSRLASVFPPAMQEQMRQGEQGYERELGHERHPQPPPGGLGSDVSREGNPYAANFGGPHPAQGFGLDLQETPIAAIAQQQQADQTGQPPLGSSASNQPPAPQQRTMVMPDRMRWIYRDPQGETQGPWSGLEMHDWYKAGFFSPELLVKKFEDPDYEPLAQLIRRIGNSREPFLVPQIGIPHGPPSSNGPSSFLGAGAVGTTVPASSGGAQPPFASSFPSFGTTLTADQQNALERRKQEEQYLMARQKEHLAQAQIAQRMQIPGAGHHNLMSGAAGQLHHHSSAQSLHSQPSFSSITSPSAYQPSPTQGPSAGGSAHVSGFFDNSFRAPQAGGLGAVGAGVDSLGHIREEEIPGIMDRLNLGNRQAPGQFGPPGQQDQHSMQVQHMLQDRARLQQEQAQHDAMQQRNEGPPVRNDRLQEFHQLQGQVSRDGVDARFQPALNKQGAAQMKPNSNQQSSIASPVVLHQGHQHSHEPLSLTEQVQQAASAQQSPAPQQIGFPQPFPPVPSQSPLPAPAAQRTGRQSVADQLQTESRELSQTPSAETSSAALAPWAKEPVEALKGPSLKEIQAIETKKAAHAEELASAARRAAFQREMEAQAQAAAAPQAPGLPASASWAATGSPATSTSSTAQAAWVKAAQKPAGAAPAKTMAQIQKEEEARKKKMAAAVASASAAAMGSVATPAAGKSYANLAGKVPATAAAGSAGGANAWTTVGASGKTKTPAAAPAAAPGMSRAASSGVVPTVQQPRKAPSRSSTMTNPGAVNAQEEFRKWAVGELRPDLNKGISADDFVAQLVFLPQDAGLITEAVHGASSTLDSRHFAEEFIRRKRLADKGLVDTTSGPPRVVASPHHAAAGNVGGGWSEVAKKSAVVKDGPSVGEVTGNFKVVAAKKKGGKK